MACTRFPLYSNHRAWPLESVSLPLASASDWRTALPRRRDVSFSPCAAGSLFTVVAGPCLAAGACFSTDNFPDGNYANDQECRIQVAAGGVPAGALLAPTRRRDSR